MNPEINTGALALIAEGNNLEDRRSYKEAIQRYEAAGRLAPLSARPPMNRGNALLAMGHPERALAEYERAISLEPEFAAVHYNHANALLALGRNAEALLSYERSISLNPHFVAAHRAHAHVLHALGRGDEAISSAERTVELAPNDKESLTFLGQLLLRAERNAKAIQTYESIVRLDPGDFDAYIGLAAAYENVMRYPEAADAYRRALALRPDYVEGLGNLGVVLRRLNQHEEAERCFRRFLDLRPSSAEAHSNLALTLRDTGRMHDAIGHLDRALQLNPKLIGAYLNLGAVQKSLGLLDEAESTIRRALAIDPDNVEAWTNVLFLACFQQRSAEEKYREASRYGELLHTRRLAFSDWSNPLVSDRTLRIGFVSGDLHDHPVGNFFGGLLTEFASSDQQVTSYAYSNGAREDDVTKAIRKNSRGGFKTINGLSDISVAECIRKDAIDILVDLSGHTGDNRLPVFALKPAPLQITWLGYLATTGVRTIDYLLADHWTLPAEQERFFTEKIWRLPDTYICFTPPVRETAVGPLPALSGQPFTFGCFNNVTKVNERVIAVWSRILNRLPESRLLLKSPQLSDPKAALDISAKFAKHGIGANRLLMKGHVPRSEHLRPYNDLDVALDPFPYPGITTTVESLWMGVPVLTLAGSTFLERQGVGLLSNAGLPDWIAADEVSYVNRAVEAARDLPTLAAIRQQLRARLSDSPLLDRSLFVRRLCSAFREMWAQRCK